MFSTSIQAHHVIYNLQVSYVFENVFSASKHLKTGAMICSVLYLNEKTFLFSVVSVLADLYMK